MPSFNGVNIFGKCVVMITVSNPRAEQKNKYPGLSGTERLDQGAMGLFTSVEGIFEVADYASLNAAEALFRSYIDGNAYIFIDNFGNSWFPVKLLSFEPQGRVRTTGGAGHA